MTEQQAEKSITEAGGSMDVFNEWMRGQTVGLNDDGTVDIYEYDVNRFIRYKCNPKNEPIHEVD